MKDTFSVSQMLFAEGWVSYSELRGRFQQNILVTHFLIVIEISYLLFAHQHCYKSV